MYHLSPPIAVNVDARPYKLRSRQAVDLYGTKKRIPCIQVQSVGLAMIRPGQKHRKHCASPVHRSCTGDG